MNRELAFIVVLQFRQRLYRAPNGILVFGVARYLTHYKFLMVFWRAGRAEGKGRDELEPDDSHHKARECDQNVEGEHALRQHTIVNLANEERLRRHVLIRSFSAESIARLSNLWVTSWPLFIVKTSTTDWSINLVSVFGGACVPSRVRRVGGVIREIVNHAIVYGNSTALLSQRVDLLWLVTYETLAEVVPHQNHHLIIPVRADW